MTTDIHGSGGVCLWCYGCSGLAVVHSTNKVYLTHSAFSQHLTSLYVAMMSDMAVGSEELGKLRKNKNKKGILWQEEAVKLRDKQIPFVPCQEKKPTT